MWTAYGCEREARRGGRMILRRRVNLVYLPDAETCSESHRNDYQGYTDEIYECRGLPLAGEIYCTEVEKVGPGV